VRPLSLGAMLKRLEFDYHALAQRKGLSFECASSEAWVSSDPAMLERVLRNLLDNAVKYTEKGGIDVAVEQRGQDVCVTVRDTGIGIDQADRELIFEEYYQARNPARDRTQGIGLGLAIVKRLCNLLGHALEVDSVTGRGSTFRILLASCESPAVREDDEAPLSADSLEELRGMVVLVIEDDVEVSEAMRTLLKDWGCQPAVAGDSAAAIALLESEG